MIVTLLIALAAGCASGLMFASIVSGALISLVLFYLAPLPLMVAALGWGPAAAAIGGLLAATGLAGLIGLTYGLAFGVTVALPAWWLGHLALLGRPVANEGASGNAEPVVEWYPIGRILLWAAAFATLTTIAALLTLGTDAETISAALRRGLMRIFGARGQSAPTANQEQLFDAMVTMAPLAAAGVAMMTLTLNLWLAGRITATSGRLKRPWPDIRHVALPPMTMVVLLLALAFCFTSGLIAIVAQIISAALMMAYGLTGLAVLHTLTLALKSRAVWLSCTYAVVIVFGWPVLAVIGLGLADALLGLRDHYWRRHQPPPSPT